MTVYHDSQSFRFNYTTCCCNVDVDPRIPLVAHALQTCVGIKCFAEGPNVAYVYVSAVEVATTYWVRYNESM